MPEVDLNEAARLLGLSVAQTRRKVKSKQLQARLDERGHYQVMIASPAVEQSSAPPTIASRLLDPTVQLEWAHQELEHRSARFELAVEHYRSQVEQGLAIIAQLLEREKTREDQIVTIFQQGQTRIEAMLGQILATRNPNLRRVEQGD